MIKEALSALAIALTFIAFAPYLRSILKGETKPHVFSWVLWGLSTFVVFLAQLADRGGAGAWPIGVSAAVTLAVAGLAWRKRADVSFTPLDRVFFLAGLMALPLWIFTADPLWAVAILTAVDVLGFLPTFRKAYAQPHEERLVFFAIIAARNLTAILALENYSATTVLFPATMALACILFILMVTRRRTLASSSRLQS